MVPEEKRNPSRKRKRRRRPAEGKEGTRRAAKPQTKPKKKRKKQPDDEPSTHKVIGMLMVAIALFGWACAAAAYAHAEEGWRANEAERFAEENSTEDLDETRFSRRRRMGGAMIKTALESLGDFIGNAFRQIPNVFSVIAFNFQHRLWLIILFACLEGGAVGLGYLMEKVGESFPDTPEY
ncbi:hypothetical protein [uncultured Gimesia sp.]|uniref:hypothetical protein n=1 Tax=uncultured Gimesia sp. TaxID=1678688 RepID=UPI0030D907B1|tara:strand:- start:898 stop:1437 length:540 start_codon:yes stop_codon:yes gene_type:complete